MRILSLLAILTLIALSVACSKGSDPQKDYRNTKNAADKSGTPVTAETLDLFKFKMISTSDIRYVTFVAGEKGNVIEFEILPRAEVKSYSAVASLAPENSRFFRKGKSNIWILSWDPDINETAKSV